METSIPSLALPGAALDLPQEGGKDLTAGMGNMPALFTGKQSGTYITRQDVNQDSAPIASAMTLSSWTSTDCGGCDCAGGASSPCVMSSGVRK